MRHPSTLVVIIAIALAGNLLACQTPDLRIIDATATATPPDAASFTFTVENRDYTGNIFRGPGKVSGPVDVHAWSSADGVTPLRPVSWYFIFLLNGEELDPGQTRSGTGHTTVDGGIDLTAEPFLILVVDDRDQKNEYNENNNSLVVPIAQP